MSSLRTLCAAALGLASALFLAAVPPVAAKGKLRLTLRQIELPGAPAKVLPVDLDGDGRGDLVILVAYTEWDQIARSELVEMDQVEGLIEMMTVVPALADRRELRVYLGQPDGSYRELEEPLELDRSVFAVAPGPPAAPVLSVGDDGVSSLQLEGETLSWRNLFEADSVLAGTGVLLPRLALTSDLDMDGVLDLLIPRHDSIAVHLGTARGLESTPASVVPLPPRTQFQAHRRRRHYPWPRLEDVDGDGRPDFVFLHPTHRWKRFWVALNDGGTSYAPLVAPMGDGESLPPLGAGAGPRRGRLPDDSFGHAEGPVISVQVGVDTSVESVESGEVDIDERPERHRLVHYGDIDGDGVAEYVFLEEMSDEDAGFRKGMKQAKRPPVRYHVYPSTASLGRSNIERLGFKATGYAFEGLENEFSIPGGFQDLDGDGRKDLISVTLDFSVFQVVRVVTTRSLSIGLDFHVWCQDEDGGFNRVQGLDLSGKFKLRLNDLRLGQLSQFAGDFDGDARSDFVQLGRGKNAAVHLGRDGCRYPAEPDLVLKLVEEPKNLGLVSVDDYDGDGLADLVVVQPQSSARDGATAPVRLDLYLSGKAQS